MSTATCIWLKHQHYHRRHHHNGPDISTNCSSCVLKQLQGKWKYLREQAGQFEALVDGVGGLTSARVALLEAQGLGLRSCRDSNVQAWLETLTLILEGQNNGSKSLIPGLDCRHSQLGRGREAQILDILSADPMLSSKLISPCCNCLFSGSIRAMLRILFRGHGRQQPCITSPLMPDVQDSLSSALLFAMRGF